MPTNRLVSLSVSGLFGRQDTLELSFDESCTVLTGGNGTGKSTILRMVWAVAAGEFETLRNAPISKLTLTFSDSPALEFTKHGSSGRLAWGRHSTNVTHSAALEALSPWARDALAEAGYDGERAAEQLFEWLPDTASPAEMSEMRRALRELTPADARMDPPRWYPELQGIFPVAFITDQRLLIEEPRPNPRDRHSPWRMRRGRVGRAVEAVSIDIAERINRADMQYARASQRIDREFPSAVIAELKKAPPERETVAQLADAVNAQRERMRNVGLLDRDATVGMALPLHEENQHLLTVVSSFLKSTQAKLEGLDDLADRLTAFKEFLDAMFVGKAVSLMREDGLGFHVGDSRIRANQLSSGEQQMVVLAHKILFETEPGTLVIIDEPEISLHIRWQDQLLGHLIDMGARSSLQFLMATHSPMILASHPEMERSLDDLRQ
ncbi:Vitamin B12 import ATP-binding protein BtuD [Propionicimonas sp. T2.31MG-18]|uniref:AAA family ATPase n=1 Tax=Propionicimonas sp. T2.31MG-18 TaxID=3157620 RepID=UPI0035EF1462